MFSALIFSFILLALTILLLLKSKSVLQLPLSWTLGSLGLKLLAAAFLWWLYTYHYSDRSAADIYKYFDDARAIEKACEEYEVSKWDFYNPWQERTAAHQKALSNTMHWDLAKVYLVNDNRTMSRIHLLILPFSKGHFWAHQLFFTLLSFWGTIMLFLFFKPFFHHKHRLLFYLLFLFPSILLWTSGALKESFLFFAMGGFLYTAQKSIDHGKIQFIPLLLVFTALLINIKIYLAIVLIPLTIPMLGLKKMNYRHYGLNSFYELVSVGIISLLLSGKEIVQKIQMKLNDFTDLALANEAGSYYEIPTYQSILDLLIYMPIALYNVLIRPIFPNSVNALSLLSALEHLILLTLLTLAVLRRKNPTENQKQLAWFCLSTFLPIAILTGSTVPVLGAITRYKVVFLPFYLCLLLTFVDLKRIPILKKLI
ncbi:MAG: hypothetical protein RIC95_15605 [Vicingaceae bacterium]